VPGDKEHQHIHIHVIHEQNNKDHYMFVLTVTSYKANFRYQSYVFIKKTMQEVREMMLGESRPALINSLDKDKYMIITEGAILTQSTLYEILEY
jgi:hypothetical protein